LPRSILLWRHAKAQDGFPDLGRVLTPQGRDQAQRLARWMAPRLPADTALWSSQATRAKQTLEPLASLCARPAQSHAWCNPDADWQSIVAQLDASAQAHVLLVGHQPWLGQVASFLQTGQAQPWSVRKASLLWFEAIDDPLRTHYALRLVIGSEHLPEP
jgi:phosphohistidine phosphatase